MPISPLTKGASTAGQVLPGFDPNPATRDGNGEPVEMKIELEKEAAR